MTVVPGLLPAVGGCSWPPSPASLCPILLCGIIAPRRPEVSRGPTSLAHEPSGVQCPPSGWCTRNHQTPKEAALSALGHAGAGVTRCEVCVPSPRGMWGELAVDLSTHRSAESLGWG